MLVGGVNDRDFKGWLWLHYLYHYPRDDYYATKTDGGEVYVDR